MYCTHWFARDWKCSFLCWWNLVQIVWIAHTCFQTVCIAQIGFWIDWRCFCPCWCEGRHAHLSHKSFDWLRLSICQWFRDGSCSVSILSHGWVGKRFFWWYCCFLQVSSFLLKNFADCEHSRIAARKNAFTLVGKHKFGGAAAFFVLGGWMRDAVDLYVMNSKQLDTALLITRLAAADKQQVCPLSFDVGTVCLCRYIIAKVQSLNTVTFHWNSEDSYGQNRKLCLGRLSQDLRRSFESYAGQNVKFLEIACRNAKVALVVGHTWDFLLVQKTCQRSTGSHTCLTLNELFQRNEIASLIPRGLSDFLLFRAWMQAHHTFTWKRLRLLDHPLYSMKQKHLMHL